MSSRTSKYKKSSTRKSLTQKNTESGVVVNTEPVLPSFTPVGELPLPQTLNIKNSFSSLLPAVKVRFHSVSNVTSKKEIQIKIGFGTTGNTCKTDTIKKDCEMDYESIIAAENSPSKWQINLQVLKKKDESILDELQFDLENNLGLRLSGDTRRHVFIFSSSLTVDLTFTLLSDLIFPIMDTNNSISDTVTNLPHSTTPSLKLTIYQAIGLISSTRIKSQVIVSLSNSKTLNVIHKSQFSYGLDPWWCTSTTIQLENPNSIIELSTMSINPDSTENIDKITFNLSDLLKYWTSEESTIWLSLPHLGGKLGIGIKALSSRLSIEDLIREKDKTGEDALKPVKKHSSSKRKTGEIKKDEKKKKRITGEIKHGELKKQHSKSKLKDSLIHTSKPSKRGISLVVKDPTENEEFEGFPVLIANIKQVTENPSTESIELRKVELDYHLTSLERRGAIKQKRKAKKSKEEMILEKRNQLVQEAQANYEKELLEIKMKHESKVNKIDEVAMSELEALKPLEEEIENYKKESIELLNIQYKKCQEAQLKYTAMKEKTINFNKTSIDLMTEDSLDEFELLSKDLDSTIASAPTTFDCNGCELTFPEEEKKDLNGRILCSNCFVRFNHQAQRAGRRSHFERIAQQVQQQQQQQQQQQPIPSPRNQQSLTGSLRLSQDQMPSAVVKENTLTHSSPQRGLFSRPQDSTKQNRTEINNNTLQPKQNPLFRTQTGEYKPASPRSHIRQGSDGLYYSNESLQAKVQEEPIAHRRKRPSLVRGRTVQPLHSNMNTNNDTKITRRPSDSSLKTSLSNKNNNNNNNETKLNIQKNDINNNNNNNNIKHVIDDDKKELSLLLNNSDTNITIINDEDKSLDDKITIPSSPSDITLLDDNVPVELCTSCLEFFPAEQVLMILGRPFCKAVCYPKLQEQAQRRGLPFDV